MGNYLASMRVPPTTRDDEDDDRNHPLYYDWSLPKWSPFRAHGPNIVASSSSIAPADGACRRPAVAIRAEGSNLAANKQNHLANKTSTTTTTTTTHNDDNDNNNKGNKTQPPPQQQQQQTASGGGQWRDGVKLADGTGAAAAAAPVAHEGLAKQQQKSRGGASLTTAKAAAKSAIKTVKSAAKEAVRKSLKGALTSTVDRADTTPINADKTTRTRQTTLKLKTGSSSGGGGGGAGKSTTTSNGHNKKTTTTTAAAAAATTTTTTTTMNDNATQRPPASSIKRVDSMRPQTIDQAKYGGIDEQAALKAATNIHTVASKTTAG